MGLDPWAICAADFPDSGSVREQLRFLLGYAILAPSGHNTQPWRFAFDGDVLELYADRTRALAVVDPNDRELTISCGAALETLLVAARHVGRRPTVELAPDGAGDLLARISITHGDPPHHGEAELFGAVVERHTNRRAFEDRELPSGLTDRLVADADAAGVWLHLVGDEERAPIAALVSEGDRAQMADKPFRRELAAWVHPNRSSSRDGMRGYGFGIGDLMSYGGPLVIRSFDQGKGQAAKDHELAVGSPLLAVLGTATDDQTAWLRTGRGLQRVLLRATAHGVCSSYLNQPIEVAALRPRLAAAIGRRGDAPQLLIRFGFGAQAKAQPRRPVAEIVADDEHL